MYRIFSALFLLLAIFCSNSGDVAGTTTETQTGKPAAIEGLIMYDTSFNSPVNDADVVLHDQSTIMIMALAKRGSLIRSGQTITNINGFFRFDSVDTGKYLIEINDHDTLGAIISATVHPTDTLVNANGILRRLGCLDGKINTDLISGTEQMRVFLPEIQRIVMVDTDGYFYIDKLPAWNYRISVIRGDSAIGTLADNVVIPVHSGDTTYVSSLGSNSVNVIINGTIIENP